MKKIAKKTRKPKKLDPAQKLMEKWGQVLSWERDGVKMIVKSYPAKNTKIELAPYDKTDELRPYVNKVLKALGHKDALVTDESYVSDFLPFLGSQGRKEAFVKFSRKMKKMGIDVDYIDSVIDVAQRLKDNE